MEAGSGTPTSPVGDVVFALLVNAEVQVVVPWVLKALNSVPVGFANVNPKVCGSPKSQPGSWVPAVITTPFAWSVDPPKPLSVRTAVVQLYVRMLPPALLNVKLPAPKSTPSTTQMPPGPSTQPDVAAKGPKENVVSANVVLVGLKSKSRPATSQPPVSVEPAMVPPGAEYVNNGVLELSAGSSNVDTVIVAALACDANVNPITIAAANANPLRTTHLPIREALEHEVCQRYGRDIKTT